MASPMDYCIREYQHADLTALAGIYRNSIHYLGGTRYSREQVAAWASFPDNKLDFEYWLKCATTFVAVDSDDACIGFAGLEDHGRISALFVAPGWMRKGVGYRLLECLLEEARLRAFAMLTTEASEFSRPLFEKFGFVVREIEHTEFKGVRFTRYAMQINFQPASGSGH